MRSRAIEEYKRSLRLSPEQREVLIGILLGDACLESQNRGRTYRLKVEQAAQHESYVRHLFEVFEPWVLSGPCQRRCTASNGSVSMSWAFSTVSHPAFRFYAQQFYAKQRKRVPKLIHRWLTPRGLAYWFMDDGSMKSGQSKGVIFNTHGFVGADVERLARVLAARFGLKAAVRFQKDGLQIYVSGESYARFVDIVDAFVLESMRHKLPPARRTHLPKR